MQDREAYATAMAALGVNARVEVTDAQRDLYWAMLADLSDEDFQRAVTAALNGCRFFPTIAELRESVTPHVDHAAAAVVAFEQVVKTGTHTPTGTRWSIRRVADIVGPVAAEAYVAAGASSAFERELGERDLPYLRKRFVDSYVEAAAAQSRGRPLALTASAPARLPVASPMQQLVAETAKAMTLPTDRAVLPGGTPVADPDTSDAAACTGYVRGDAWEGAR